MPVACSRVAAVIKLQNVIHQVLRDRLCRDRFGILKRQLKRDRVFLVIASQLRLDSDRLPHLLQNFGERLGTPLARVKPVLLDNLEQGWSAGYLLAYAGDPALDLLIARIEQEQQSGSWGDSTSISALD